MRVVHTRLRNLLTRAYLRSPTVRRLHHGWAAFRESTVPIGHLGRYGEEEALGPIQREEALLLFALARVLRPLTIVDFGFHRGHSGLNFLMALPDGAELHSYDIDPRAEELAEVFTGAVGGAAGRFRFHAKDQREFSPSDLGGREVDLALLDASHDLAINRETFERVAPAMAEGAVLAVHDTGTWHRDRMDEAHLEWAKASNGTWIGPDEFSPWPEERRFVRWVVDQHPGWGFVHLHSARTLRHGLTLLQKPLARPVGADGELPRERR